MSRAVQWTERQKRIVREQYGTLTLAQLVERLGIPKGPIHRMADKLGLVNHRPERPGLDKWIAAKYREEWSDAEIADGWNRRHPQARTERHYVGRARARMGLPFRGWTARRLRRHKQFVKAWLRQRGYRSMGDIRAKSMQAFVESRGWPTHLRPRHVQILDYLWEHGPATRPQIAAAIGMSTTRGQRHLLSFTSHVRKTRGSYLSDLLAEGLVQRSEGRIGTCGPTKYHRCCMYWIAPGVERRTSDAQSSSAGDQRAAAAG